MVLFVIKINKNMSVVLDGRVCVYLFIQAKCTGLYSRLVGGGNTTFIGFKKILFKNIFLNW